MMNEVKLCRPLNHSMRKLQNFVTENHLKHSVEAATSSVRKEFCWGMKWLGAGKNKVYTTTTERKSFGQLFWPQKSFSGQWWIQKSYLKKTRNPYLPHTFSSVAPFFSGMLSFSQGGMESSCFHTLNLYLFRSLKLEDQESYSTKLSAPRHRNRNR